METLKHRISREYLEAFKSKNFIKKNLLGVIKGEITTQEKNLMISDLSDQGTFKILNKIAKGIRESVQSGVLDADVELEIIESFLPRQMSEQEIKTAVEQIIIETGLSEMGKVMSTFSSRYQGRADGKTASKIVREILT